MAEPLDFDVAASTAAAEPDANEVVDAMLTVPEGSASDKVIEGQAVLVAGAEGDPLSYQNAAMAPDKQALFAQAVQQHHAQVFGDISQQVQGALETAPQSLPGVVAGAQERVAKMEQDSQDSMSKELAVVEQVASHAPIDVEEEVKKKQAVRLAALNDMAQLMDRQGIFAAIADYSGLLIPFGVFNDINDVVDDFTFDWTNATDIERLALDWHALPAERQAQVWPEFRDAVIEAMGTDGLSKKNIVKAGIFFTQLFEPRGGQALRSEQIFDLLLGAVDIATLKSAKALTGGAVQILRRKANLVKLTKELGDGARAAGMNMGAMTDEGIAAATGVDKGQAYNNALPLDMGFDPGRVNLTEEMTTILNDFQRKSEQAAISITDESELIHIGAFRQEDVKYKIRSTMQELRRKKSDYFNEGIIMTDLKVVEVAPGKLRATYKLKNTKAAPGGERLAKAKALEAQAAKIAQKKWGDEFQFVTEGDWPKEAQKLMDEARSLLDGTTDEVVNDSQQVTEIINMSRHDVHGTFEATVEGRLPGIGEVLLSPSAMSKVGTDGDFHKAFKQAESLASVSPAATSRLLALAQAAIRPVSGVLGKNSLKKVEAVLEWGDEFINPDTALRGKVFTPEELITGVNTRSGTVKLTSPAEQEVYYKYRMVMDQFARLRNKAVRDEMVLNGIDKDIAFNGKHVAGHTFDNSGTAKASVRERGARAAFDEDSYDTVVLTDDVIDDVYKKGYVVTRFMDDQAVKHVNGTTEHVEYAIVPRSNVTDLPEWVIHTKPGYVPKFNKGVEYLVKEFVPGFKQGVPKFGTTKTIRFFSSKEEALTFRQQMVDDFIQKHPDVSPDEAARRFEAVADRELTPLQRARDASGSSGGMYYGARSSEPIKMGIGGVDVQRISPVEAMQRNAQSLGAFVTRNEWRIGEEQRWINTLRAYAKRGEGLNPEDILDFNSTRLPNNAFGIQMERQRELIRMWAGMPTRDEQLTGAWVQRLHDWILAGSNKARRVVGLKDKTSVDSLLWLKHSSPITAAKSAVMHAALGVFNISQIPVQASAATVAASRYPRLAPRAIPQAFRMMILDNIKDETVLGDLMRAWGWDVDDMDEMYKAWKITGLKESVRSNADISVADNYGYVTMDGMKRISDASLFTYRTGELFNRRFSFAISYANWKRMHPGKTPTPKQIEAEILQDANKSMLELGHANRAFWQGGPDAGVFRNILGLATQFWQVTAKATEMVFKGEARGGFTAMEKIRILLGQAALFGGAGIPVAGFWYDEMFEWMGMEAKDQKEAEYINQGMMGVLMGAIGADVDVAGRISPFGGGLRLVKDILYDDSSIMEKALGTFGHFGGRGMQAIAELRPLLLKGLDSDHELTKADYFAALRAIGKVPSSGRNLLKAFMMHNSHMIIDKHGNLVVGPKDFSFGTEIMAALGFRPNEELRTRIVQMDNKDFDALATETADVIMTLWHEYLSYNRGDPDAANGLAITIGVLFDTIDNPMLQQMVREKVERKIHTDPTSIQARELKKLLERTMPDEIHKGFELDMQSLGSDVGSTKAIVLPFSD